MIDRYANLQIGCLETKWRTGLKRVTAFSILIRSLKENAKKLGSRVGAVVEHSPSTNVAQVRFADSAS